MNCSQEVDHGDKSGDDQVGSSLCSAVCNLLSVLQFSRVFIGVEQMTGVGQDETPQEVPATPGQRVHLLQL